jgi:hypothetical protein
MKLFTGYRRTPPPSGVAYNPYTEAQYQGVLFDDGRVCVRWLTKVRSIGVWDSLVDFLAIHGHKGDYTTELYWHDLTGGGAWTDVDLKFIPGPAEPAG